MTTHYRTQALILNKRNFREADRFFTLFSKEFGKIEAMAKGERKIKSKLRGGLELFYWSEIEFIQGRHWKTLTDASLIDNFKSIRKNLDRLKIAYKITQVADGLIKEPEPDLDIWNLLIRTFEKLNTSNPPFITYQYFFWNLVSLLGYRPEVFQCAVCSKKLNLSHLYFSPNQGGLVCSNCKAESFIKISSEPVKIIRLILNKNWNQLKKLNIKSNHKQSLKKVSDFYFSYIVE